MSLATAELPADPDALRAFAVACQAELKAADAYEVAAYKRVQVALRSGNMAWVYVRA